MTRFSTAGLGGPVIQPCSPQALHDTPLHPSSTFTPPTITHLSPLSHSALLVKSSLGHGLLSTLARKNGQRSISAAARLIVWDFLDFSNKGKYFIISSLNKRDRTRCQVEPCLLDRTGTNTSTNNSVKKTPFSGVSSLLSLVRIPPTHSVSGVFVHNSLVSSSYVHVIW